MSDLKNGLVISSAAWKLSQYLKNMYIKKKKKKITLREQNKTEMP